MQPSPTTYAYPLPPKQVALGHPAGDGDHDDLLAGMWSIAFYALFVGFVRGWVPTWGFVVLGVCAFVRNFNALHEGFHAKRPVSRWWLGRHLFVVTSPFMLGYDPLRRNHSLHHTWAQQPARDPDAYLAYGPAWRGLFNAITQPEQGFFRYVAREGWSREIVGRLALHSAVFGAVAWFGGPTGFIAWLVVTRIGNTASWFIFDWILHHDTVWPGTDAPGLPAVVRTVWTGLFGRDNLLGVEHHTLHHLYPFVPGRELPALADSVREQAVPLPHPPIGAVR